MRLSPLLFFLARFLIYPAIITTTLLYLFPLFTGCEFPPPTASQPATCYINGTSSPPPSNPAIPTTAPFRLLAFGDPQLEGDTSLPDPSAPLLPSLLRLNHLRRDAPLAYNSQVVRAAAHDLYAYDIPRALYAARKRLDLLGNDFYLAHIYRSLHWWLRPTHVAVLGDMLGSQWIGDDEFARRADRFWARVFRGGARVEDAIVNAGRGHAEVLGADDRWNRRVITVPGNHDVGYAGDLTRARMDRFERAFGKANWDVTFTLPAANTSSERIAEGGKKEDADARPAIRLFALNSMNLDGPALDPDLQAETYAYINDAIARSPPVDSATLNIILTHVPLHKSAGVCVDAPYFTYHDASAGRGSGIREQNHLSEGASAPLLEGILAKSANALTPGRGAGRPGLILAGHDHEGCDVWHWADGEAGAWRAHAFDSPAGRAQRDDASAPGVREVTLRAMMGGYGGFAYAISAWFDADAGEWRTAVGVCQAGVQHIWWGVHVLDIVVVACSVGGVFSAIAEEVAELRAARRQRRQRALLRRERSKSRSSTPGGMHRRRRSKSKSRSRASTPAGADATGRTHRATTPGGGSSSVRRRQRDTDSVASVR